VTDSAAREPLPVLGDYQLSRSIHTDGPNSQDATWIFGKIMQFAFAAQKVPLAPLVPARRWEDNSAVWVDMPGDWQYPAHPH
jgi:hypothetical protein